MKGIAGVQDMKAEATAEPWRILPSKWRRCRTLVPLRCFQADADELTADAVMAPALQLDNDCDW
jgi:hypothetical protein